MNYNNEKLNKKIWNDIYKKTERVETTLKVDKDIPRIAKLFKERGIKRVLDLGCGAGRHLIYLASESFDAYGLDFSSEAVKKAKQRLAKMKTKADLKVASMFTKFPYSSSFFDAVISITTLHHGRIEQIKKAISEIERVLRPSGLIFITVPKKRSKKEIPKERLFGIRFIAPRTYVILGGEEKGIVHYQFNKNLLKKAYKNFKIHNIWVDEGSYRLLGELKK